MALSSIETSITYAGNGSTVTEYAIPFAFIAADHITASVGADEDDLTLLDSGDFTVIRNGNGGTLTTNTAVLASAIIVISRATPKTQPATFQLQGPLPSKTIETGLDRLAMQIQEDSAALEETRARVAALELIVDGEPGEEGTVPSPSARGLARVVYLAMRTDNLPGTGTAGDPFDASTAAKHDTLMRTFQDSGVAYVITYGVGTFLTHGRRHDVGASNPTTGTIGWSISAANWTIQGQGKGITTLKLVSFPAYAFLVHTVIYCDPIAQNTGVTVRNLTVDCNQPALAGWPEDWAASACGCYSIGDITYENVEAINFYSNVESVVEGFILFGHSANLPAHWDPLEPPTGITFRAIKCDVHDGNGPEGLGYSVGIGLYNSNGRVEIIDCKVYDIRNEWSGGIQFFGNGIRIQGNYIKSWQPIYLDTGDADNVSIIDNILIREELEAREGGYGVVTFYTAFGGKIFIRSADAAGSMAGKYVDIPIRPTGLSSPDKDDYVIRAWLRRDGGGSAPSAPTRGVLVPCTYSTGDTAIEIRDAIIATLNTHFGGAASGALNPYTTAILSVSPITGFEVSDQPAYGTVPTNDETKLGFEYGNRVNGWRVLLNYMEAPRPTDFGDGGDSLVFVGSADMLTWAKNWTVCFNQFVATGDGEATMPDVQLRSVGEGVIVAFNQLAGGWVQTYDRNTSGGNSELQGTETIFGNRTETGAVPANPGYQEVLPNLGFGASIFTSSTNPTTTIVNSNSGGGAQTIRFYEDSAGLKVLRSAQASTANVLSYVEALAVNPAALDTRTFRTGIYGATSVFEWEFVDASKTAQLAPSGFALAVGMNVGLNAGNISTDNTTGTKIGTATAQKLGFWNATPVAQQVLATGGGATADNIITLLQTLGLCRQS